MFYDWMNVWFDESEFWCLDGIWKPKVCLGIEIVTPEKNPSFMMEWMFSLMRVWLSLRKQNLISGQNMETTRATFRNAGIEIVTPQKSQVYYGMNV